MPKCRILAAIVIAAPSLAFAAEIPTPSKVEAVTVFPSGAEVTRTLKVKLEAGDTRSWWMASRARPFPPPFA